MIPWNLFFSNILEKLSKLFQSKWKFSFISFFLAINLDKGKKKKPSSCCYCNFSFFFSRNSKEKLKVSMLPFEWEIFHSVFIGAIWEENLFIIQRTNERRSDVKKWEKSKTHNGIHCYVYIHLKKFLCVSTLISGLSPHFPAALFSFRFPYISTIAVIASLQPWLTCYALHSKIARKREESLTLTQKMEKNFVHEESRERKKRNFYN